MKKYIVVLKHDFQINVFSFVLSKYTNNLFSMLEKKNMQKYKNDSNSLLFYLIVKKQTISYFYWNYVEFNMVADILLLRKNKCILCLPKVYYIRL